MPVLINIDLNDPHDHHLVARGAGGNRAGKTSPGGRRCLDIGLINNMPDSALMATEWQLFDLLQAAAGNLVVRLHFYTMEAMRSAWGRDYVRRHYRGTDDLFNASLDGIIVTDTEPRATRLTDESYWPAFTQMLEWAQENTVSSVFSCLAVHGAVLHLDGVERQALAAKCSGVFAQAKVTPHPLLDGLPAGFKTPHSRWNGVQEQSLADCDYSVLTRSAQVGVDCFVKQQKNSLFVHFQGHPEYDALSLLGEYRRDIGRFLRGESDVCPTIPTGYFTEAAEAQLAAFRRRAMTGRDPEFFASFPTDQLAKDVKCGWRPGARRIYRNWLLYLEAQRAGQSMRRCRGWPARAQVV